MEAWRVLTGRAFCRAGLGRVYFRSSQAYWSAWESISIKRIWAFCWGIANHHIYLFHFSLSVALAVSPFLPPSVSCPLLPPLNRWEIFLILSFFFFFYLQHLWASLRAASSVLSDRIKRCCMQPRLKTTVFRKDMIIAGLQLWLFLTLSKWLLYICWWHLTFFCQT